VSRRAFFEIRSGWVEDLGCAPNRIPLYGNLEFASEFPRLKPSYGAVGLGLARVWQSPVGFQITAFGRDNVVIINDAPVHDALLKHGDLFSWKDVTLRFVVSDEPEHREPRLEAAIAASPDDEACWQVYADWLLSVGDPLGERIRGLRADDAEFLGHLRPLVTEHGVLTLEWSHGFIRSALLRAWGCVQLDELLVWLLELPVARFLRSLDIELRSFVARQEGPFPDRLTRVLQHAQTVLGDAALPALEQLRLGPLFVPVDASLLQQVAPRNAPRLAPGCHLDLRTDAWLEVERTSEATGLTAGMRWPLQPTTPRLQLYESPRVLVGSIYWDDGWNLFEAQPEDWRLRLSVNGKEPTTWHPLRVGDVIESGEWLRVRFCA
jgi:uncharacterized protein (TIGR02996 family)